MKLVFIDEFKPSTKKGQKMYGISAVIIDSAYYTNYKQGFDKAFAKLGWSKDKELKGKHVYASGIFEDITVDQRIQFAEDLFKLSLSGSGRRKRISVFIAFDIFSPEKDEHEIYRELLCRIFKKIGSPINQTQDKNLIAIFLDNNDAVTSKINEIELYKLISDTLPKRWIIFEKPFFVKSSNLLPGIIFADFVSYFHQNFLGTNSFFKATVSEFMALLDLPVLKMTETEKEKLQNYLTNYKKRKSTARILEILREIQYVK